MAMEGIGYTRPLADHICAQLRAGRRLGDICAGPGMPHAVTVRKWVRRDCDGFAARYTQVKAGRGRRPRVAYSRELADEICAQLHSGRTLVEICRDAGMPPHTTVWRWQQSDHDGFGTRCRLAREAVSQASIDSVRERERAGAPVLPRGRTADATMPRPRRVVYTPPMADYICAQLRAGRALSEICRDACLPAATTVERWVRRDCDGFAVRYTPLRRTSVPGTVSYSWMLTHEICDRVMAGRSLADVCRDADMPLASTVRRWADQDRDGFAGRYRAARLFGQFAVLDEMLEIADDCSDDLIVRSGRHGDRLMPNPANVRRARLRLRERRTQCERFLRDALVKWDEGRDTLAEVMQELEERRQRRSNQVASRE